MDLNERRSFMALIEVDHVTKQYVKVAKIGVVKKKRTLFTAVDDVSFAVEPEIGRASCRERVCLYV